MSGILGVLRVLGLYDGRKFDAPVDRSRKKTREFGSDVDDLGSKFVALNNTMQLVTGVSGQLGQLASLADGFALAERRSTNFAVGLGISRESLLRYERAAQRLRLDQDAMNDALLELNRRSAEATTGTGSMADSLKVLNIDAEKFVQLRLEDKFDLIAKKLAEVDNVSQRGFLTDEIFGGSSDELTGFIGKLNDLAKGFSDVTIAAESGAMQKFSRDWLEITGQLRDAGRGLLIDVSPLVLEAIDGLKVIGESIGAFADDARSDPGSIAGFLGEKRRSAINILGFLGQVAYLDFDQAIASQRAAINVAPADYRRRLQFREARDIRPPEIENRPVQLLPSSL